MVFFEDVEIGCEVDLGAQIFTAEAIKEFAQQFDPQHFHLDAEKSRQSLFGGLCASGWHTASVWARLMNGHLAREAALARARGETVVAPAPSPGFQDMVWRKPVFAGDTIRFLTRPKEKIVLEDKPGWGLILSENEGWNEDNVLVFSFTSETILPLRAIHAR